MRKFIKDIIIVLALSIPAFAFSQKKDSVKPVQYDTAFVFSIKEIVLLKDILMESKVISGGNQLTGKELQQLFAWIDQRVRVFKKEQPK